MSRDLTADERQKFIQLYGLGRVCEACGETTVTVKIWEKYGSSADEIGGDISSTGIVGAVVACGQCGHGQTLARRRILQTG